MNLLRKLFTNNLTWTNIFKFFLFSTTALIPFHNRYISYLFILWLFFALVYNFLNKKTFQERFHRIGWLLSLPIYFVVISLSILYSEDKTGGMKILETQVLLLVLPFLFIISFNRKSSLPDLRIVAIIYCISLFLYIVISIILFIDKGLLENVQRGLGYGTKLYQFARKYNLSFIHHTSYFSLYLLWGVILAIKLYKTVKSWGINLLIIILQLIFIGYLWLLNSRTSLLTLLLIILYFFVKELIWKRNFIKLLFGLIILSGVLIGGLKYSRLGDLNFSQQNFLENSRLIVWRESIDLLSQKPLFGYGVGDYNEVLYKETSLTDKELSELKLNSHNQFLEASLQSGLIGGLILLLIFAIPTIKFLDQRDELLLLFLMICFISFCFESMLQRLAGVLFFTFWYSYLFLISKYKK